jgi:hypothetical protein
METSVQVFGKQCTVQVHKTGKVTWTATGTIVYEGMHGQKLEKHISETGRSQAAALNTWQIVAQYTMDY